MTEMLRSIRTDLLSRRLLPVLILLAVALLAALAYAMDGGSGSGSAPTASATGGSASSGTTALSVSVASTNPNAAASETPAGARYQSQSVTRDPFVPLASPATSASGAKGSTTGASANAGGSSPGGSSGGSSGGSPSGGSGSSGGSAPTPAPKPSKPAKPQPTYTVTALFGLVPASPAQSPALSSYANLKPQAPLPSKQEIRIVFERVSSAGSGAIFKLVLPPILRGQGKCLPSTSECEAVDLAVGQSEELEYVEANGQAVVYELKVASIKKSSSGASAARVGHGAAAHAADRTAARDARRRSKHAPAVSASRVRRGSARSSKRK